MTSVGKIVYRLAVLALGAGALASSLAARAQVSSGPPPGGLQVAAAPSALDDPVVKRCRLLAARRTDPNIPPMETAVENAASRLMPGPVLDAVATCRAALAAHPNEPRVIIAQYIASEALSMMALGLKFPDSEAEALKALQAILNVPGSPGGAGGAMFKQISAFYVASAYEYGVGTRPDRAAAMKWYAVAAEAGDAISKRELARLKAAPPAAPAQAALHVDSPPAVLDDPVVKRCRLLAARRTDPDVAPMLTAVEQAAQELRFEPVFDAVATCRAALAAHPNEPKVIIAHYNASEALSLLALGVKLPDSEAEALAFALHEAANESEDMGKQLLAFYIASAYEHGIGTKPDRAAAMKWYAVGAEAGDAISKRELARLQAAKP
jgi:TPR repeat protein